MNISRADLLMWLARQFVGVHEEGGPNKGALVERFQRAVDGKAQGEPWCCAFVQYLIAEVDRFALGHGDVGESSLAKTEWVRGLWEQSPRQLRVDFPRRGALILWEQLGADGKPTSAGHVGLITGISMAGKISTIEGNTGPGAGVQRDGDGVWERERSLAGEGSMKILGFLTPWRD
ncbi:MAG: CHAP domain-containing protein [Deltaproteobacteria bacterium]|nr:CHAP domain-containing protein [Deltaproteobacteria bacterium]